jgi:predicted MFS family arabinose efflux permease
MASAVLDRSTTAPTRRHARGFWAVTFAFTVAMACSTIVSPLYGLYQARDGFSSFVVTLIYAAYALGVVISLVLAGHLSDWHGRRRVLLIALTVPLLAEVVFLVWRDVPGLILARIIIGLSVGATTATATAYIAELNASARPDGSPRRAQLVATAANLGGLGVGPLVGGLLAQWVGHPLTVPFLVCAAALLASITLVLATPETRERPVPMPRYRPQRVAVPAETRARFAAAALGAFMSFGALGLFTGLQGTILVTALHRTSHALAGATLFALYAAGVIAQAATIAWPLRRTLAVSIVTMVAGMALTVVAVWMSPASLAVFIVGGCITGAGAGMIFRGCVGTVIEITPAPRRAEALAALFLAGYLGLSVPVLGAGIALQSVSIKDTLLGFAIAVGLGTIAAAPKLLSRGDGPAPAAA